MMYVYVIRSEKDGRFYVGMTGNVEKRVKEHNKGRTKAQKDLLLGNCFSLRNMKIE